jgi:ActR/RegA family two-component response regulator
MPATASDSKTGNPDARVMLITGDPSVASAQEATELGVVVYLVKPFTNLSERRERIAAAGSVKGASHWPTSPKREPSWAC